MLESELNITLFERTTRKFTPTLAGELFIRRAKLILSELESSQRELKALDQHKKAYAIVTGSPMTAPKLVPTAIAHLMENYEDIGISIRGDFDSNYAGKLQALEDGQLDIVLSVLDLPMQDDGLIREQLVVPELMIIARKDHPISVLKQQNMNELRKYPWIFPPNVGGPRVIFDNEFNAEGVPAPSEYIEISNRQAILSLLRQSDYLTALPYHPACAEEGWSDIYVSPTRFMIQPLSIAIITRSRAHLSPAAKIFIKILKEIVRKSEKTWDRQGIVSDH
jgi:DNA-binding transcriptional LysR family regulator